MKKINLNDEEKRDFYQSLLTKLQSFCKEVFQPNKPLHGKELKEHLLSKAESEEEKETLTEILDEINAYHQKRKDFEISGKDIHSWYEDEIERVVRKIKQDPTREEIDQVKEAIAKLIDDEIELSVQALEEMVEEEIGKEE